MSFFILYFCTVEKSNKYVLIAFIFANHKIKSIKFTNQGLIAIIHCIVEKNTSLEFTELDLSFSSNWPHASHTISKSCFPSLQI